MSNNLDINYIINNVIYVINEHYKNSISSTLKNYLYLIATGMILNYGDSYIEDIYKTIFMINFTDDNKYKKIFNNSLLYINPTDNNYLEKEITFNKRLKEFNYNLVYKEIDNSPIKTLEYLTYEINYIMFNAKNKKNLSNIKLKLSPVSSKFIFKINNKDNLLQKIFNVIQTEEIIKRILKLDINFIRNKEFKELILQYKDIDINTYELEGLDILANLFKPLYRNRKFKSIIDSYNNTELIKKELDSVLGKNAYKNTYKQILVIDDLINNKTENNYFLLSNYYVDIRNNIINRYIEIKGI